VNKGVQVVQPITNKEADEPKYKPKEPKDGKKPQNGDNTLSVSVETKSKEEEVKTGTTVDFQPKTVREKVLHAVEHAVQVKLEDGRDWVQLYKFLSQKPDVGVLGISLRLSYIAA